MLSDYLKNYGLVKRDYSELIKGKNGKFVSTQFLPRKEYMKEYLKKYYEINKEKIHKKQRAWRKTPKGKASRRKEYSSEKGRLADKRRTKKYIKTDKGKLTYLLLRHRQLAKKYNVKNKFTKKEWKKLKESTEGFCISCRKFVGLSNITIDHIIPYSKAPKGFVYTIKNIQAICRHCNEKKGVKIVNYNGLKHGKEAKK